MFDFSPFLNLPLIWGVIIALAVFLYVLLDGFDLGIGIIFPFAPSTQCRNKMANSIDLTTIFLNKMGFVLRLVF